MQNVSDLELQLNNTPDAIERVFRVVRHRGFQIQSCQFSCSELESDSLSDSLSEIDHDKGRVYAYEIEADKCFGQEIQKSHEFGSQYVRMRVSSQRKIGLLTEQLKKLFSVKALVVHSCNEHSKTRQQQTKTTGYFYDKQHSVV
jgi:acetolactate synthase regulatory subunit